MNCPVCNRSHTADLSICLSCGAMVNDSVREELVGKVSAAKPVNIETKKNTMSKNSLESVKAIAQKTVSAAAPISATSEIAAKSTNPTLVEFHSKNAKLPEWRLQLQNVVRQRQEHERLEIERAENEIETVASAPHAQLVTSGANALKAEIVEEPQPILHENPDVARALQRINDSRKKFLAREEPPAAPTVSTVAKPNKNYPFYIAAKTNDAAIKPAEKNPPIYSFAKPKLAAPLKIEKEKLDTNKLPPLSQITQTAAAKVSEEPEIKIAAAPQTETVEIIETVNAVAAEETQVEEYDDCPTFAMRFNAGLFDLIIGSFVSLVLLSPFILFGGSWISWAGFFAFAATVAVVMFIYLTTTVGLYGKTFGMRLFSMELIDVADGDYPTFHQAAVSSAVYLLSLALGGIGFLTLLLNDDKRAVQDLVSGTIVVREE
ncbi:MAG: RDD family protein [Pyrinomonadaceae bacterium]